VTVNLSGLVVVEMERPLGIVVVLLGVIVLGLHLGEVLGTARRDQDVAGEEDVFLELQDVLSVGSLGLHHPRHLFLELLKCRLDVYPMHPISLLRLGHLVLLLPCVVSLRIIHHLLVEHLDDGRFLPLRDTDDSGEDRLAHVKLDLI